MKKLILAVSALVSATVFFAAPASAQYCGSYYGRQDGGCTRPSANRSRQYDQYQQQGGYNGGYYDNGYPPIYVETNRVKIRTARRGGRWYKECDSDPAVNIDTPCAATQQPAPQLSQSRAEPRPGTTSTYMDGSFLVTETVDADGTRKVTLERDGQRIEMPYRAN